MANNPFETLGLTSDATADEVKSKWKSLASQHHPDRGGDASTFAEMREAYNEAIKLASKPKKCLACNGTGKRKKSNGFSTINIRCSVCNGRGLIK